MASTDVEIWGDEIKFWLLVTGEGYKFEFLSFENSHFSLSSRTHDRGGGVPKFLSLEYSHFPFRAELTTGEGVLIGIYQPRKQSFFPFVQNSRPKPQIHSFSFISLNVWGGGGVNLLHLNLGGGVENTVVYLPSRVQMMFSCIFNENYIEYIHQTLDLLKLFLKFWGDGRYSILPTLNSGGDASPNPPPALTPVALALALSPL